MPSWPDWSHVDSYFDDLAVLALGPIHPGGAAATGELLTAVPLAGRRVLDAGCGNGSTIRLVERLGGVSVGLERSICMIEAARQMGTPSNQIVIGDLRRPPFRPGSFDVVIAEGVLGFVPNVAQVASQLAALVRVGGSFLVSDWIPDGDATPHAPGYGFVVFGETHPGRLRDALGDVFDCRLDIRPSVTRPFDLDPAEAERRVFAFFSNAPACEVAAVVRRKLERMRATLDRPITRSRFILIATRMRA